MSLAVGSQVELSIIDIAFGGEGVARIDEFVVFVPFVALGELVRAEITEVKKSFARAKLLDVVTLSPHRVTPPCPYFGVCGGCQYQHIDYPVQLQIKHKQIADLFQRIGGFPEAAVFPVVGCPQPYGYRNRIMIRSQWNKLKQGLEIGFIMADSKFVVDITECKIAEPEVSAQIMNVRANPPPKGGIKVVLRRLPEGWEVPRDSFFQNNFILLPQLVDGVRDMLRASGTENLIDVYCGVGFFALELADLVKEYVGIELDIPAIRAARKNAVLKNKPNGEFLAGTADEMLPRSVARFSPDKTTVLVDPPRTGITKDSLELLQKAGARQIIYVSCHPATLARDLKFLCAEGKYRLEKVVPFDMFPQTQHVECVADLRAVAQT